MTKKERERITAMYYRLSELGFTFTEAEALRRISMTLSHWGESECNGEIARDETDGKAYHYWYVSTQEGTLGYRRQVRDMETGAIKRANDIVRPHEGIDWYYQTDPRGAAVYIYQCKDWEIGKDISAIYSSIGIAVY